MLPYNVVIFVILAAISMALVSSVLKFFKLGKNGRIVSILLLVTLIVEVIADYAARKYQNNLPVYGLFSPLQLLLISLYFNYSIDSFKRKNVGLLIGIIGIVFGYVDYFFIQRPHEMNNIFLLTESIIVVAMCLYAFYRMLLSDDDLRLVTYPHFWFTTIFLFFWTGTFLIWGLYDFMIEDLGISKAVLHNSLLVINVTTYLAFSAVFIFYKKMQLSHAE